jgi:hypothetical protein
VLTWQGMEALRERFFLWGDEVERRLVPDRARGISTDFMPGEVAQRIVTNRRCSTPRGKLAILDPSAEEKIS